MADSIAICRRRLRTLDGSSTRSRIQAQPRRRERVNKTQSAVSMQIRRLEDQLGSPLFAKRGRGVRLTESGEKLIDYARQMLQIEAAAFASVSRKALAGRVRLGIPDDYADNFLP